MHWHNADLCATYLLVRFHPPSPIPGDELMPNIDTKLCCVKGSGFPWYGEEAALFKVMTMIWRSGEISEKGRKEVEIGDHRKWKLGAVEEVGEVELIRGESTTKRRYQNQIRYNEEHPLATERWGTKPRRIVFRTVFQRNMTRAWIMRFPSHIIKIPKQTRLQRDAISLPELDQTSERGLTWRYY